MRRGKPDKFFYERRKRPKKVPVSLTIDPELLERIDAARMPGESRAKAVTKILVAGLPPIERMAKVMKAPQAALAPIAEEEKER